MNSDLNIPMQINIIIALLLVMATIATAVIFIKFSKEEKGIVLFIISAFISATVIFWTGSFIGDLFINNTSTPVAKLANTEFVASNNSTGQFLLIAFDENNRLKYNQLGDSHDVIYTSDNANTLEFQTPDSKKYTIKIEKIYHSYLCRKYIQTTGKIEVTDDTGSTQIMEVRKIMSDSSIN